MLTATPLLNRVRRRLGSAHDYREASSRAWTLEPGCERIERPAIYDPHDLDRVTGVQSDTTMEHELERIQGGPVSHGPTRAYVLRDVQMMHGHLFQPGMTHALGSAPVPWFGTQPRLERSQGVLANSRYGLQYFGHWLSDDLPMALVARRLGEPVGPAFEPTQHQKAYAQLCDVQVQHLPDTSFKELIVLDDVGQNRSKRARVAELRARIRASRTPRRHAGVILLRKASGSGRMLANEDVVAASLRERGFKVACPGEDSAEAILDACLGARIVVGVEGSHLAHGLMCMDDGGTIVVLQPPFRFNNVYKDRCDCMGLRYGFVVGEQRADDFSIDIGQLHRLLDRVERVAQAAW
jgi:capsular polysaccharide biosynthesis protein